MSQELDLFKKGGKFKFAETFHPDESASQLPSNMLHDPDEEYDGLSPKERIIKTKMQYERGKGSNVSSKSKVVVPYGKAWEMSSNMSKGSNKSDAKGMLQGGGVLSNARQSDSSLKSKTLASLINKALEEVAGSDVSKVTSSASKSSSTRCKEPDSVESAVYNASNASSRVSSASKALIKAQSMVPKAPLKTSKAPESSASKTSSAALEKPQSVLATEDVTSEILSASSTKSGASRKPETILAMEDAPSEVSMVSSAKSSSSSSASKAKDAGSTVSKASSTKSSKVSRTSKSSSRSGKSRALGPANKAERKISPLQNEIKLEDLDDIYSLSIHERGPLANMPDRDDLLAQILHKQPEMDIDEASVIVDNQIATASQIGRANAGSGVSAPASETGSSSELKSHVSNAPSKLLLPPPSGTVCSKSPTKTDVSKASSTKSKSVLPPANDFKSELRSSLSKAPSAKGNVPASTISSELESYVSRASGSAKKALMPSTPELETRSAATPSPMSALSSSSKFFVFPNTGNSPILATTSSSLFRPEKAEGTSISDLLALANLCSQREFQCSQAVAAFEASRSLLGGDANRNRMAELELAKQSLEDSRILTRLQELRIHDDKGATLARHAHEDQLSALARAETAEADRRASKLSSALRDKESQERARHRERRGDIAKEERRRQDERDIEIQKENERLDHDQKMEKIDSFGRWVDAATPRNAPQPRRSGLALE